MKNQRSRNRNAEHGQDGGGIDLPVALASGLRNFSAATGFGKDTIMAAAMRKFLGRAQAEATDKSGQDRGDGPGRSTGAKRVSL